MPSIYDFATWAPLARLLTVGALEKLVVEGGFVVGAVSRSGSVHTSRLGNGSSAHRRAQWEAEQLVAAGLNEFGLDESGLDEFGLSRIAYCLQVSPAGDAVLDLFDYGSAVEDVTSPYPVSMVLRDGAVPQPWRRLPSPAPDAGPAPSADPARLERLLRQRLVDPVGVTDAQIAAAQARLGVSLPAELTALYRVTSGSRGDQKYTDALGCELLPIDELSIADSRRRSSPWYYAAGEAARTPSDATVQGLPGSPGWIVFASDGGTARFAVDLTPGAAGHLGQIIVLDDGRSIGGDLVADSLTAMIEHGSQDWRPARPDEWPAVARINANAFSSVDAAAHPELEVLVIGRWDGEPLSLAAAVGLPRLRTLQAQAGTLADPMQIARISGLEYLAIGVHEWRVLLQAAAVPRGLSAAGIEIDGQEDPREVVALANELLALWNRPLVSRTTLSGNLQPN
ncbi:SMI1/KNR4 family protein [Paractinoplanes durhamensis]|uniref:SMI1/KNR4 family protein n=1 Tax=Paractinoplanes durhamensis TaxID=113563 RepID=A0ABQ3YW92_9ACTN|nr:SMI1/KNR4 family protein [Actinoplanes durhamensis]GIE01843.1 SMI1/KNR4 family protein [Actinoplanes durhamensis]